MLRHIIVSVLRRLSWFIPPVTGLVEREDFFPLSFFFNLFGKWTRTWTWRVVTALREARAPGDEQSLRKRCDVSAEEFERRHALVQDKFFWAWQQGTDNATHFKSKENLNFWSERPQNHSE